MRRAGHDQAKTRLTVRVVNPEAPVAGALGDGSKQLVVATSALAVFPDNGVVYALVDLLASRDFDSYCAVDSDGKRGNDKLGDLHDKFQERSLRSLRCVY
jgi:hypothetical protein